MMGTFGAGNEADAMAPSRFAWQHLDPVGRVLLWGELADWVAQLRDRYQLGSRVPPCWWCHDPVVEELTALMAAHTAAYHVAPELRDVPREDLAAWHTQWLWPTVERLTRISDFSGCQPHACGYIHRPQPVLPGLDALTDGSADAAQTHFGPTSTSGQRAAGPFPP
ncbi:hypothetical protein [Nocardia aurantia]|uniref:DUF4913 domain-containing protein n=1 Tax=Nocardia aurantia TaxID=2585199 RepID=A0A7K0DT07_9NOCA|nr:hypothetical protein [Nocardia aurantia]MQY28905.1 hypothetical protein [Nocardia aurantia]